MQAQPRQVRYPKRRSWAPRLGGRFCNLILMLSKRPINTGSAVSGPSVASARFARSAMIMYAVPEPSSNILLHPPGRSEQKLDAWVAMRVNPQFRSPNHRFIDTASRCSVERKFVTSSGEGRVLLHRASNLLLFGCLCNWRTRLDHSNGAVSWAINDYDISPNAYGSSYHTTRQGFILEPAVSG